MAPKTHMPIEPLENIARARHARMTGGDFSDNDFARQVGVSNRAVARWRAAGGQIPWTTADVAAISLGLHPVVIWPEEWRALDTRLVDGTDLRAMKAVDAAIEQIGTVMNERLLAALEETQELLEEAVERFREPEPDTIFFAQVP